MNPHLWVRVLGFSWQFSQTDLQSQDSPQKTAMDFIWFSYFLMQGLKQSYASVSQEKVCVPMPNSAGFLIEINNVEPRVELCGWSACIAPVKPWVWSPA